MSILAMTEPANPARAHENLTPRAVAALCALRTGPRDLQQIRRSIGDDAVRHTEELMRDVAELGLATGTRVGWVLREDGRAWLETHGVPVEWVQTLDGMLAAGAIPSIGVPGIPDVTDEQIYRLQALPDLTVAERWDCQIALRQTETYRPREYVDAARTRCAMALHARATKASDDEANDRSEP